MLNSPMIERVPLDPAEISGNDGNLMKVFRPLLHTIFPAVLFVTAALIGAENKIEISSQRAASPFYARETDAPAIQAEAAVLLDFETGTVLYEKNADRPIPPASLTKLMTMHLILKRIDAGGFSYDQLLEVPEEAYWKNLPPGSSLMFLEPGQIITMEDLLLGLAVSSGNDAALAAALIISGSIDAFLEEMNGEAAGLGFPLLHFEDPSGLDPRSCITAAQFAEFCRFYLTVHPEALERFHSVTEFTYPKGRNLPETAAVRGYTQRNRNALLGSYPGLDGLKSGYIEESGYNVAVTAEREGMRLIAVILGGTGDGHFDGRNRLAEDGRALLDYGYGTFIHVRPVNLDCGTVRIWKGRNDSVGIIPNAPIVLTVREDEASAIDYSLHIKEALIAPVFAGTPAGELTVSIGGEEYRSFPLVAAETVEEAGPLKRIFHSIGILIDGRNRHN